jgi:hypothetical protein
MNNITHGLVRLGVVAGFASVAALAAAPSAGAQTRNWDGDAAACNAGSFQACMSVQVSLTQDVLFPNSQYDGTTVTMRVQNLQSASGLGGPFYIPGWLMLSGLLFTDDVFYESGVAGGPAGLEGGAGTVNLTTPGTGRWVFAGGPSTDGWLQRQAQPDDRGYVIGGCQPLEPSFFPTSPNVPRYPYETGYFTTCGDDAAVVFSFTTREFNFTDNTSFGILGSEYNLGVCTSGLDCPTTVTPEPATMLLLGSGLAAIGGWSRRRRQRANA